MPKVLTLKKEEFKSLVSEFIGKSKYLAETTRQTRDIIDKCAITIPIHDYNLLIEAEENYHKASDDFDYSRVLDDDWQCNPYALENYFSMDSYSTLIKRILQKVIYTCKLEDDIRIDFYIITEEIQNKLGLNIDEYLDFCFKLLNYLEDCESAIERKYLLALVLEAYRKDYGLVIISDSGNWMLKNGKLFIKIHLQKIIASYRVDFFIALEAPFEILYKDNEIPIIEGKTFSSVIIECQGREHHYQRNKQINETHSGLRKLQADGYDVLFFSGSEINNEPNICAIRTYSFLINRIIRETSSFLNQNQNNQPTIN